MLHFKLEWAYDNLYYNKLVTFLSSADPAVRDHFMDVICSKFPQWSERGVEPAVLDVVDSAFIGKYFPNSMVIQVNQVGLSFSEDMFGYCVKNQKWDFVNAIGNNYKLHLQSWGFVRWDDVYTANPEFAAIVQDNHILASKILVWVSQRKGLSSVKTLLELENSPFPINVEDTSGKTLAGYSTRPEDLKWLFEHGYIPRKSELVADRQDINSVRMVDSVNHDNIANPLVAAATKFYITKLLDIVKRDANFVTTQVCI